MQKQLHKNKNGLGKILNLAFQMNASGKQRKYSKEYILATSIPQLSE